MIEPTQGVSTSNLNIASNTSLSNSKDYSVLQSKWKRRFIRTFKGLKMLEKIIKNRRLEDQDKKLIISIDTETYGVGKEAINERLSLVQVGLPPRGKKDGITYLVDIISLEEDMNLRRQRGEDVPQSALAPLKDILEDSNIIKVIQHQQFERDQFSKYGIILNPIPSVDIYDTEMEARVLIPGLVSYSLAALTKELLGASLSKDEQTSLWGNRPLTAEQENYAALDPEATYLIYQQLEDLRKAQAFSQDISIQEVEEEIIQARFTALKLKRPIAFDLAVSNYAIDMLKVAAEDVLKLWLQAHGKEEGVFKDEEWGSCMLKTKQDRRVLVDKLIDLLPEAKTLVKHKISKKDLIAFLVDAGVKLEDAELFFYAVKYEELSSPKLSVEFSEIQLYERDDQLCNVALIPLSIEGVDSNGLYQWLKNNSKDNVFLMLNGDNFILTSDSVKSYGVQISKKEFNQAFRSFPDLFQKNFYYWKTKSSERLPRMPKGISLTDISGIIRNLRPDLDNFFASPELFLAEFIGIKLDATQLNSSYRDEHLFAKLNFAFQYFLPYLQQIEENSQLLCQKVYKESINASYNQGDIFLEDRLSAILRATVLLYNERENLLRGLRSEDAIATNKYLNGLNIILDFLFENLGPDQKEAIYNTEVAVFKASRRVVSRLNLKRAKEMFPEDIANSLLQVASTVTLADLDQFLLRKGFTIKEREELKKAVLIESENKNAKPSFNFIPRRSKIYYF